jgi:hypothetical protein
MTLTRLSRLSAIEQRRSSAARRQGSPARRGRKMFRRACCAPLPRSIVGMVRADQPQPQHALEFMAAFDRTDHYGLKVLLQLLIEKSGVDLKTAMPVPGPLLVESADNSVAVLHKTAESIKVPHCIGLRKTRCVAGCKPALPLSKYRP